ncbi:MAG: glutamate ABC transporter substrate-binding protein [Chloroflexi bacterium]|nr:glutamate ABC transporter substrate-binding protein [Chloroflexota bacterium]
MRTFIRPVAVALAVLFVSAACGGTGGTTAPSAAAPSAAASAASTQPKFELSTYMYAIQTKGKLRVGTREDNVPFGLKNPQSGKFEGFDIDIARELAKGIFGPVANIDEKIEWVPVVSATRIPTLQDNKADLVIATFTINADRKKQIDFSDVYFSTGQKILVKKTNTSIKGPADMNGKTICAATGSTSIDNIKTAAPQAKTLALDSYPPCLLALQQGTADAVSTDETILFGLVKQDPSTNIVGPYFSEEPYGIGVKKSTGDRTGFVDYINRQLVAMIQDGRWARAYETWVSPVSNDKKKSPDSR